MSKISTVYDEIRALIPANLSGYTELNNPYTITDEADLNFDKGYAVGLGAGTNTNRLLSCAMSISRDFVLTLTKRMFLTNRDITNRIIAEKALFEDQITLVKKFELATSSAISKIEYVSDNGLEFLEADRFGILVLQFVVRVEYFETI